MNGRPSGRCCRIRREACVVWTIDVSSTASAGCCDPAHHGAICRIVTVHAPPATTVSSGGEGPEYGSGSCPMTTREPWHPYHPIIEALLLSQSPLRFIATGSAWRNLVFSIELHRWPLRANLQMRV